VKTRSLKTKIKKRGRAGSLVLATDGLPLDPDLDPGIRRFVEILNQGGIETFESCQGGKGHSYPEPTIRFHGGRGEGFRALAIAQQNCLPTASVRRTWPISDGEPVGPYWEMTFYHRADE